MFNWATLPVSGFAIRLAIVFSAFFCTIGLPVSAVTFNPETEPVQCIVAASAGSLVIVLVTVIRLYLGWSHVGDRLLSATVIYEETGWYDGQVNSNDYFSFFLGTLCFFGKPFEVFYVFSSLHGRYVLMY